MCIKKIKPIKSSDRDERGEHYWICPNCKSRVGGFNINGSYEENKFCNGCGVKLNWKLFWNDINRVCE